MLQCDNCYGHGLGLPILPTMEWQWVVTPRINEWQHYNKRRRENAMMKVFITFTWAKQATDRDIRLNGQSLDNLQTGIWQL